MAKSALKFQPPQEEAGERTYKIGGPVFHSYNEFCLVSVDGYGLCVIDVFDKTFMPIKKVESERSD